MSDTFARLAEHYRQLAGAEVAMAKLALTNEARSRHYAKAAQYWKLANTHAAEAFLKSMLSNRATHPETFVQKVASRVSPPALDRARASLGVTCQNETLALPKTKPGPRSPSMVVAHMRDRRGMGQRKTKVPRTPAW